MATCYNKNTAAYRALQNEFTNSLVIDSIIAKWQTLNNTETIPTVADATEYMSDQKALFNLKKREYSTALLANISRQKIMSQWDGSYYLNNTNTTTKKLDRNLLVSNRLRLEKYLDFWNVPQSLVDVKPTRTGKTYKVSINQGLLTKTDIIPETNNKDNTRILDIIQHMNVMFPDISINVVSLKQAKEYYKSLPDWQKSNIPFEEVNSYYVNSQAVLIKGKVTTETLVEEVLHPFIDTIYQENKGLYNGLLSEAKIMFPDLAQQIEDTYTKRRGFDQTTRDLELVTQALSRHFNKEYENQPTQKWYQKIIELLKFFSNILENFYNFMSGNDLIVSTNLLRPTATLSDLAKVLNTGSLQFDFSNQSVINNKVKFSLTPKMKKNLEFYKGLATTDVQSDAIVQLLNGATESNKKIPGFTVSSKLTNSNKPLVIHIKNPHSYVDIESGETYESTTKKIKGELNDPGNNYEFNRELGNDFDKIAEALALNSAEFPEMKILNEEQVKEAVGILTTALDYYRKQGAVIIPQVVVADAPSNTAGSIDLLAVHDDGTLQVIDLKTSKNSSRDSRYFGRGSGLTNKQKGLYEVNEGSVFYNPNKPFYMSTGMQHSMQVNIYRRMLVNMGYEVRDKSETFHLLVGVKGFGKNQKFTGSIKVEAPITHLASQNLTYINEIVPLNVDTVTKERIDNENIVAEDGIKLTAEEAKPDTDVLNFETYEALDTTIRAFEQKVIERSDAIILLKSKIKQTNEDQRLLVELDNMSGLINSALVEGTADVAYEELVAMSIKEIDDFNIYALDPKNFNKFEYIDRVLSFENFAKTFSGLNNVGKGNENIQLNQRQFALKDKLSRKLNDVLGDNASQTPGIISTSIQNYIRTFVKNNSNQNFSEADLTDLLNSADDIGMFGMATGDMSTSSDTLLALMDKLYKNQIQKSLDIIDNRNDHVRRLVSKGEKLSPRGKVDYGFMLQFDKDGKFTGRYVKKIGYQYYSKRSDLYKGTKDELGDGMEYIYKDNIEDYDQTELEHNKKLYKAKSRLGNFLSAEKIVNGEYQDGDYHRYTKEYKDARKLVMTWVKSQSNEFGYWEKRNDVSNNVYTKFKNKYHKISNFTSVNRDGNNEMNGTVKQPVTGDRFPKSKYVEKREISSPETGGEIMLDAKYREIMNPSPDSALGEWQKEFYMMWIKFYEKDLLEKIPPAQMAQMIGKTPIIMDNTLKHAAKSGNLVTKLWGRTTRGFKDFWTTSMETQTVQTDEHGNLINTLPLFYVGNPRTDEALTNIEIKIQDLYKAYQSPENKLTEKEYNNYKADLESQRMRLQSQPTVDQLSTDMGDNLLRFSAMAENYEVMGEIKNTITSMMKVIEKRVYTPSGMSKLMTNVKGVVSKVTSPTEDLYNSNTVARAKKWMKMVYYDNDKATRNLADNISSTLISASSLTYIGFNIWGNINNYAVGRINNSIEAIGGRFFDADAYLRAEREFNTHALPGFFKRIGQNSDISRNIPGSKYEAVAILYRMMDDSSDIRESNKSKGKETGWDQFKSFGYLVQDGAEYNVQTKVGIAIIMSKKIKTKSGDEMSLYDAYQFNNITGELTLKEGYDQLVNDKNGELAGEDVLISDFSDNSRYEIRNYIREVNKQTHGNYAHVDRMVIQSHWLGKLGAQFHKWVAPAIKARYRGEYYDENLGWMEGRYISSAKFFLYFFKNLKDIGSITKNFAEKYDSEDKGKGSNKVAGLWRTGAEMMMMMSSFAMARLLESLFDDDDDDKSQTTKRLENAFIYQMNRQARELLFFMPGLGVREVFMMAKSPIAVTRMLGEIGEATWQTMWFPGAWTWDKLIDDDYNVKEDKTYYYQRGSRKGQAKIGKEWSDVIPIWYTINRFKAYDTQKDFFVK